MVPLKPPPASVITAAAAKGYYTRPEVAALLGIQPQSVKYLHDRLPHTFTLGGHRRFETGPVDAEAQRRAAARNTPTSPTRKDPQC